jgi:hypothetical protein
MRFPFRELPAAGGGVLTPRPVVDIALEGLDAAPVGCLLDTGVWFCDPWPHPFGLAGLEGFQHHFIVTVRAYDGYLDVEPNP